eukprot:scaffold65441_cov66-Phaeocystis_antarctica.AAC.4
MMDSFSSRISSTGTRERVAISPRSACTPSHKVDTSCAAWACTSESPETHAAWNCVNASMPLSAIPGFIRRCKMRKRVGLAGRRPEAGAALRLRNLGVKLGSDGRQEAAAAGAGGRAATAAHGGRRLRACSFCCSNLWNNRPATEKAWFDDGEFRIVLGAPPRCVVPSDTQHGRRGGGAVEPAGC